ncbi:MAG TPA: DUF6079 family protein [Blastocatellia bacterium]|nr:DUF6079 family protein [Blastocatellia bacterium]
MPQIKDFVELTPYDETTHFRDSDPEQVISAYLLTDLTANSVSALLTYLSSAAPLPGKMICGLRGVGKSHLLTVIHRLAENPSRRTKIQHQQVRTLAGRLGALLPITLYLDSDLRTPFSDALAAAVRAATHGTISFQPSGDRGRDLILLSESLISVTPVFLVDGVSARLKSGVRERVKDDIEWLEALGEIAQTGKIKVIITLDEDVAKGNHELTVFAHNYQSEYIGIECLKELISQRLFKKSSRQRVELQALYKRVKSRLPHFYWSEADFVALFPLHPIVLEVTAALRSHTTAFSLLGFAASAGVRAAGRPLLSMIMLDEAFDRFEYELRKDSSLSQAFVTYDKLANSIVSTGPVASRITTRLLLKSLFIFSLTGRGIGIHRLAEGLMLVDDRVDGYSIASACLLELDQKASNSIISMSETGEKNYMLPIGDANDLESAIESEAETIADNDHRLLETLVGIGGRYFSDWPFSYDRQHASLTERAVMRVLWRGAEREGVISFERQSNFIFEETIAQNIGENTPTEITDSLLELDLEPHESQPLPTTSAIANETDWQVILLPPDVAPPEQSTIPSGVLFWIASEYGAAENGQGPRGSDWRYIVKLFLVAQRFSAEASRISPRLELLLGDLRSRVVERFESIYITNGSLVGRHVDSPLKSQRPNQTISGLFVSLLDPALTVKFPQHPVFGGLVTLDKIESLHRGLLCGENPNDTWVQSYAGQFAAPLSLVHMLNGQYELDLESDECATSPIMLAVRKLIEGSPQGVVPLADVIGLMRRPPFGLQAPIQRLLLSALVAGWQVELTNSAATDVLTPANLAKDLDLSRYTLLRRTATIVYSTERLSEWCSRLLGQQIWFDLSTADGRRQVREAFAEWQQRWTSLDLDRRVAALPEEAPTARIGQIYYTCRRYFDRMAAAVTAMLQGRVPLEQGLTHIVDIFAGSESVFDRLAQDLVKLTDFLEWAPWATHAREFIDTADYTGNERIETLRHNLAAFWEEPNRLLDPTDRQRMFEQAEEFIGAYQTLYIESHDSAQRRNAFDVLTDLLHSPEWQKCQNEIQSHGISERLLAITSLVNEASHHRCDSQVKNSLLSSSHCDCGFTLYAPDDLERLVAMLRRLLKEETDSATRQPYAFHQEPPILSATHPITDALKELDFNV